MQTKLSKVQLTLGTISIILFSICLGIAIAIWNIPLYLICIKSLNIPQDLGMPLQTIYRNYLELLKYLHLPWVEELNLPDFNSSVSGAFHFAEVKNLFYLEYLLLFISTVGMGTFVYFLKREKCFWQLKNIFRILAFIPPVIILLLLFSFEPIFILFHKVFFNNDAWQFNPQTDPIILVLPQEFFLLCFLQVFLILEIALLVFYILGKRGQQKSF